MADNENTVPTSNETQSPPIRRGVVGVDGQSYAVGLTWQPVQNLDDPLTEIKETVASEPGADLYCYRQTSVAQYGIGHSSMGHRNGMPSLAASVAEALAAHESFCAVFKVKEGWWFVAARNNLILAEEDVLFETEEDARRAYASMMAVPDWDVKIVPEEWGMEGTQQDSLSSLTRKGMKVRLQDINAARKTYFLIFIAAIIVIALIALVYALVGLWKNLTPKQVIQPVQTPQVIQPVAPEPEKPKPWEQLTEVNALIRACWNDIYQIKSVSFPGWRLGLITCNSEGIKTNWTKSGREGLLSWLRFGVKEYQFTELTVDTNNPSTASASITFKDLPTIASMPTLSVKELQEDLTEIQQMTGLGFQFSQQTMLDPPTNPDGSRPASQKTYTYFSFSTNSDYTPWEWIKFFEKFSGFELSKIEYNPSNDTTTKWKYEGRIYAK